MAINQNFSDLKKSRTYSHIFGLARRLAFFFFLITTNSFSQEGDMLNKEEWKKLSNKVDYTESYRTKKPKKKRVERRPRKKEREASFFGSLKTAKYIVWGIIIAIIATGLIFIIMHVVKKQNQNLRITKKEEVAYFNIDDVEESELEKLLRESLEGKSYKLALRVKYLMLIKQLDSLKLINWKKDKTNGIYLREMYGKTGFDLFRELTIKFERFWYGDKEISIDDYNGLLPVYDNLSNQLIVNE